MNFLRKFIGATATDEVALIPSGKLFLTRAPLLPKGAMECLFIDAFALIRQTTRPFYYQLCITRVYQEGELDAHGLSGFDDSDDDDDEDRENAHSITDSTSGSKDEWSFAIVEDLQIHWYNKADGTRAIAWKDLNGDFGDKFEFNVDEDVKLSDVDAFMLALYKCLYEVKYHKSSLGIRHSSELDEFIFTPKPDLLSMENLKGTRILQYDSEEEDDDEDEEDPEGVDLDSSSDLLKGSSSVVTTVVDTETLLSLKTLEPKGHIIYRSSAFTLHLYDSQAGSFKRKAEVGEVSLKIIDLDNDWRYSLYITSKATDTPISFSAAITKKMKPTFNYEHLSFIFNYLTFDQKEDSAFSWLLKFTSIKDLLVFQNAFMVALWESSNKKKYARSIETDQVVDAFAKLNVDDNKCDNKPKTETSDLEYTTAREEYDGPIGGTTAPRSSRR